MKLSKKLWEKIQGLVPDGVVREDGKGRSWADRRRVLEGMLWVVKTSARWRDLPKEYPPYQTCHRRFQGWVEAGVYDQIIEALVRDLWDRGGIDMSECFTRGRFSVANKGGYLWERLKEVKATLGSWPSSASWRTVVFFYLSESNLPALMKSP